MARAMPRGFRARRREARMGARRASHAARDAPSRLRPRERLCSSRRPVLWLDHLLAVTLVVIGPLRSGTVGLRRLERAELDELPRVRIGVYRTAILLQW